ncbi:MAG TPA: hypothetical protein VFP72_14400, partial [Kineosporiaceae bacterium]|nr:hypothetical protein [Kineosporiaceae bacterium]
AFAPGRAAGRTAGSGGAGRLGLTSWQALTGSIQKPDRSGRPAPTFDGSRVIVAQAVVLPTAAPVTIQEA